MAVTGISANRAELLQIADAVAREKSIEREVVVEAIEEAMMRGAKARYGNDHDIRAHMDPKTGELTLTRVVTVMPDELVENEYAQVRLSDALKTNPQAFVDMEITETLPPMELGRVQTQMARQTVLQKVRDAERERQFEEYKDRVTDIVNGTVKRVEYGNTIVDLGRGEGIMRRDQSIPRETFNIGDRIRCYIYDVRRELKGPQILLSRAHPGFMAKLFAQEVPEVYDGVIEIKSGRPRPRQPRQDGRPEQRQRHRPRGRLRGHARLARPGGGGRAAGREDRHHPVVAGRSNVLVNGLAPAEVTKVVMDEEEERVEVVVPDEQLSLAIGRRGQNVRLASQLTGWQIDILTESQESERRQREFAERTQLFQEALDVDETIAQLLVTEGFQTVEDLAYVEAQEVADIEGFDEDTAEELQTRAREFLEREAAALDAKRTELGVEDGVLEVEGVTLPMAVALGEAGVKTLEDLADLATDEIRGGYETKGGERVRVPGALESFNLSQEDAEALVLRARVAAGWIDADALEPPAEEYAEEGELEPEQA
jgi:N utilization substance protein A